MFRWLKKRVCSHKNFYFHLLNSRSIYDYRKECLDCKRFLGYHKLPEALNQVYDYMRKQGIKYFE